MTPVEAKKTSSSGHARSGAPEGAAAVQRLHHIEGGEVRAGDPRADGEIGEADAAAGGRGDTTPDDLVGLAEGDAAPREGVRELGRERQIPRSGGAHPLAV